MESNLSENNKGQHIQMKDNLVQIYSKRPNHKYVNPSTLISTALSQHGALKTKVLGKASSASNWFLYITTLLTL